DRRPRGGGCGCARGGGCGCARGDGCGWARRGRFRCAPSASRREPRRVTEPGPVVCCDLDGVIWRGDAPVAGAAAGVAILRDAGIRVAFLSNNSSLPVGEVVAKLARFEVPAEPADVLTSALATAALLRADLGAGTRILTCAGPGVTEALLAVGLLPVEA